MFSRHIPSQALADWCRSLRHLQEAGLTLAQSLTQQGQSGPSAAVRAVSARLGERLARGESFSDGLALDANRFPPLFVAMAHVGEESGRLPEVFGELEQFFTMQATLRRRFRRQIFGPVLQFSFAVLVIAGLIFLLGWIAESRPGQEPIDALGLGLFGARGAFTFLGVVVGTLLAGYGGFRLTRALARGRPGVDGFLLRVPGIGTALQSLALTRFSLGMHATLEAGMPVHHAVRLGLAATGNPAYIAATHSIVRRIRSGREVAEALDQGVLFPTDFLAVVETAEMSGQLPEVMRRQATHYAEEAGRQLGSLTSLAAKTVYVLVAVLIVIALVRMYATYLERLGG